jgi:hypothetical protein
MPALLILGVLLALSFWGLGSPAEGRTARARASGGSVPILDIESGCRSLSSYDPGKTVNFDGCMKEERDARGELEKSWRSVPADRREQCLYLVTPPALPSYVALQGCLTIAHDAAELAKKGRTSPNAEPSALRIFQKAGTSPDYEASASAWRGAYTLSTSIRIGPQGHCLHSGGIALLAVRHP